MLQFTSCLMTETGTGPTRVMGRESRNLTYLYFLLDQAANHITEGISGAYFRNADTPESTVQFLQYLQEHGIGLEVGVWDWTSGGFGSARWDFPSPKDNSFTGLSCHQKGYGLGKVVES